MIAVPCHNRRTKAIARAMIGATPWLRRTLLSHCTAPRAASCSSTGRAIIQQHTREPKATLCVVTTCVSTLSASNHQTAAAPRQARWHDNIMYSG